MRLNKVMFVCNIVCWLHLYKSGNLPSVGRSARMSASGLNVTLNSNVCHRHSVVNACEVLRLHFPIAAATSMHFPSRLTCP